VGICSRLLRVALATAVVLPVAACGVDRGPASPQSASPVGTLDALPTPVATAVPPASAMTPASPEATIPSQPAEFAPPSPACPAPPDAVRVPDVTVSVGSSAIRATNGSSTFTTCSTVAMADAAPADPAVGVAAHLGDVMTLTPSVGWRILRWEGSDRNASGEGANIWAAVDTPERPARIEVPVPVRTGDSIAGYTLWLVSADSRIVGQLDILVRVRVR
jgi:hypothetical protein